MKEMSISTQRARDLVAAYGHSLEQQIVRHGSSLACRDEELWKEAEGLLRDGDAQETHCFGLDPLRVMEESLKTVTSAPRTAGAGRVQARGGLLGLAKAFEVLEQAALNLYLGPWREEYKVVKMYSGMFTHYIKPVLSMPQIEKLFGLLGYQPSTSRHEQLCLQSARVGPASPDDLLCLSCAFFLSRCECRLLLTALGKNIGEAQWELSVVKERQRGSSLQVALDNTKKMLEVNQPLMEQFDGDPDEDLYTDDQINGRQRQALPNDHESPRSLTLVTQSRASPPAVKTHSNGVMSLSTSEDVSTFSCYLTKTPPLESDINRSPSAGTRQDMRPREESRFDTADSRSRSLQVEAMGQSGAEVSHICGCLQTSHQSLKHCSQCNTMHDSTCELLKFCYMESHSVVSFDNITEDAKESGGVSPQGRSIRASGLSASPTLTSSSAAMSSLTLHDDPTAIIASPMTYHDCCDLGEPDPDVLCISCGVFHSGSCRGLVFCQDHHEIKPLGVCSCGKTCSRKPRILCRYCGVEYCWDCWYRNPLECTCGKTLDQSSPV